MPKHLAEGDEAKPDAPTGDQARTVAASRHRLISYDTAVRLTARRVLERADLGGACGRKWVVSI